MSELKPCPFCGSKARWKQLGAEPYPVGGVDCLNESCGIHVGGGNKAAAIAAWNRRPEPVGLSEETRERERMQTVINATEQWLSDNNFKNLDEVEAALLSRPPAPSESEVLSLKAKYFGLLETHREKFSSLRSQLEAMDKALAAWMAVAFPPQWEAKLAAIVEQSKAALLRQAPAESAPKDECENCPGCDRCASPHEQPDGPEAAKPCREVPMCGMTEPHSHAGPNPTRPAEYPPEVKEALEWWGLFYLRPVISATDDLHPAWYTHGKVLASYIRAQSEGKR